MKKKGGEEKLLWSSNKIGENVMWLSFCCLQLSPFFLRVETPLKAKKSYASPIPQRQVKKTRRIHKCNWNEVFLQFDLFPWNCTFPGLSIVIIYGQKCRILKSHFWTVFDYFLTQMTVDSSELLQYIGDIQPFAPLANGRLESGHVLATLKY